MSRPDRRGVEDARNQLPALLAEAERGRSTIITRHGREIAMIGPVHSGARSRQKSLLSLEGAGKGLWGKNVAKTLRKLRDEWDR